MKSIVFVCALLIASVLLSHGQDKPKASPSPVAMPTPESKRIDESWAHLKLTEAETASGMKLQGEYDAADKALEALLKDMQALIDDKDMLLAAWKAKALYSNFATTRGRVTAWFTAAQKAHGCEGCLLEKGVFVKPQEKK